jgi:effector-binding domain-containing protein
MSTQPYEIAIEDVEQVPLAVVDDVAFAENIGPKIQAASSLLYPKLAELGVVGLGKDVVVYHPSPEARWDVAPGIPIEVGVQLQKPLASASASAPIRASLTPAARVATTLHRGPYHDLPQAHMAVHAWCGEHGHAMAGRNWEVYGQHDADDPSKLETRVYYELA